MGRRVASVCNQVQNRPNSTHLGKPQQSFKMADVAMYAAAAQQTDQMQIVLAVGDVVQTRVQRRMLEETAVLDGDIDAHNVLVDNAARAQVEMSDFGVAHLPFWQADRTPRCVENRAFIGAQPVVVVGGIGLDNGVVGSTLTHAPAVKNNQCDRFHLAFHSCLVE